MPRAVHNSSPLRVLFVGNSFTARNDLPGLVAQLAAARGRMLEHRLVFAGGASLRAHWNAGQVQVAIQKGNYHCVVLQEQSTLPLKNAKRMHENIRLFDAVIKTAGAKTVLYQTWARLSAADSQALINDAYTSVGKELNAAVVPVGTAWQLVLNKKKTLVLHDRDGSHPSLAGSYLAACVFLAALLDENPVGIEHKVPGLEAKDQPLLQKAAWQACGASR